MSPNRGENKKCWKPPDRKLSKHNGGWSVDSWQFCDICDGEPLLGNWNVTLSNGCWWPPTRGWNDHFESPGLLISTDAGLLPSTVVPRPEWSLGILGGHFPYSSPPCGGNSPTGDEWLQGTLPRSHCLLFSHLVPPVFFACSFHIHFSIKLHGKFMQLLLKKIWMPFNDQKVNFHQKRGVLLAVGHVFYLVVEPNPFEKYARQNGFISPNFRGEHEKYLSCHHLCPFTPSIGDRLIPPWLVELLLHWVLYTPTDWVFRCHGPQGLRFWLGPRGGNLGFGFNQSPHADCQPSSNWKSCSGKSPDQWRWHSRRVLGWSWDEWWSDQWVLSYLINRIFLGVKWPTY